MTYPIELKPYMRVSTACMGNWLVLPNHPSLGLFRKDVLILFSPEQGGWNPVEFEESTRDVYKDYNITAVYANPSNVMELLNPNVVGEKLWDRAQQAEQAHMRIKARITELRAELDKLEQEAV